MTGTIEQTAAPPGAHAFDFICNGACIPGLAATDKPGTIRELVTSLSIAGAIHASDIDDIVASILQREELGTTGIGRGIGIPHTKHPAAEASIGVFGTSETGIDFDSLDAEPVHAVFLLISPPDQPGSHLRALEKISTILRNETTVKLLVQSRSVSEILEVIEEGAT